MRDDDPDCVMWLMSEHLFLFYDIGQQKCIIE